MKFSRSDVDLRVINIRLVLWGDRDPDRTPVTYRSTCFIAICYHVVLAVAHTEFNEVCCPIVVELINAVLWRDF